MNGLDPENWDDLRALAHRALDDTFDALRDERDAPAWRAMPAGARASVGGDPLPNAPSDAADVYAQFAELIAPYAVDNRHPRFFGWVHGAGTPTGILGRCWLPG